MSQSFPEELVYPALPRRSRGGPTHTMVARGTALWESLVGKPRGKASRESHRSIDPREGNRDSSATAREESERACPHSRRELTPLGRLQKYPKIHVSTGEESSDSGPDSTQGLRWEVVTCLFLCSALINGKQLDIFSNVGISF